jgi:hypothetical protein
MMIVGCSQWKSQVHWVGNPDYIDLSDKHDLSPEKKGYHPAYAKKGCCEAPLISFVGVLITAPYAALTVIWHIFRVIIVTCYLLVRIIHDYLEKASKHSFTHIAFNRFKNIWSQWGVFASVIVRTPLATIGMFVGHIYTMIDPVPNSLNGRKLVAISETFLNRGVSLHKSIWIVECCEEDNLCGGMEGFEFEGGGDPNKLGDYALYVFGCYQPIAYVKPDMKEVLTRSGKLVKNAKVIKTRSFCP